MKNSRRDRPRRASAQRAAPAASRTAARATNAGLDPREHREDEQQGRRGKCARAAAPSAAAERAAQSPAPADRARRSATNEARSASRPRRSTWTVDSQTAQMKRHQRADRMRAATGQAPSRSRAGPRRSAAGTRTAGPDARRTRHRREVDREQQRQRRARHRRVLERRRDRLVAAPAPPPEHQRARRSAPGRHVKIPIARVSCLRQELEDPAPLIERGQDERQHGEHRPGLRYATHASPTLRSSR